MKLNIIYPKIVTKDETLFKHHAQIVEFCKKMKVSLPAETAKFFRVRENELSKIDLTRSTRIPIIIKQFNLLTEGFQQYYNRELDLMQFEVNIEEMLLEKTNNTILVELSGLNQYAQGD